MADCEYNAFNYEDSGSDMESCDRTSYDDGIAMEADDPYEENQYISKHSAVVMTVEELENEMKKTVAVVASIIQAPLGTCRILLNKHHWKMENLLESFYGHPDTTTFLLDAQVLPNPKERVPEPTSAVAECEICCIESELSGLDCNHRACSHCWRMYLGTKINVNNTCEIECIYSGCKLLVEDEKLLSYITDETARNAYLRMTTNSYVETNRLLRWCPGVNCGKAIKVLHCEPRLVVCTCQERFCFFCGNQWHEPVDCRLLRLWLKKCDSETRNWIIANTKDCPKCQVTIEKNGGCNYMVCKNPSCLTPFCWLCLRPWESYGSHSYSCNRYDDTAAKEARNAQETARANLQRDLFYYNRYMGHNQSLKLEEKLYASLNLKMDRMQQTSMSLIDVKFLRKAVDVLTNCRRTLMYTYVFAHYLQKDNNSEIFEDNQKDLEIETEKLSAFLEQDLDSVNDVEHLIALKQKVQDKCRYVENRRGILLKHCLEGTENGQWTYIE